MPRRSLKEELRLRADVERRLALGENVSQIAQATGVAPTTIRRYRQESLPQGQPITVAPTDLD